MRGQEVVPLVMLAALGVTPSPHPHPLEGERRRKGRRLSSGRRGDRYRGSASGEVGDVKRRAVFCCLFS